MSKLRVVTLLAVLVAGLMILSACSSSTEQEAGFVSYEFDRSTSTGMFDLGTPTGNARVRLEDGTEVIADCPVQRIAKNARVTVQQNSDGTWVVLGLAEK
ncbi:MAG: hypothetical protein U1E26_09820 [Coriobacteriia bacterium]|nr:hypothetical protein [Coriobacteriia bacterium]